MLSPFLPAPLAESESSITDRFLERKVQRKAEAFGYTSTEQLSVHWSTMDLSSAYQLISSSYVLVPYLQTGIKITFFTLAFYWSFLFKYQALIQGPSPPTPMSAAEHGGTSLQNPAPAVPSSAPALAVLEG